MKKTLLALAVVAAAGSVNAAEIYSGDNSKVSLKGEVDILLTTSEQDNFNGSTSKADADISTWGKIQLDAEHKINDSLTSFASFEIETTKIADKENVARFDDVLVGVKTDVWGVAFGEVGDLAESMDAIQKDDITNEGNYMGSTGGNHKESDGHGAVFKIKAAEGLVLVADVNTDADENVDNTYGVSADYTMGDYSIGASYLTGDAAADIDYSVMGVSGSAQFGDLFLALTYAEYEGNDGYGYWDSADKMSGDTLGFAAAYQIEKLRLYTTYSLAKADEITATGADVDVESTNLVVGADYEVLSNVTGFLEYQTADYDNNVKTYDADTVTAGVYYTF
ncbi:porin [Vibrio cortegadensis]|uniref:porin n=1 Tax=Vibrio cortegadensis TaxID=1328770 RepID=UPI0021C3A9DC|nr:porin [Vibrio cortegadensis]MDN3698077.1 porin [Vibrio cortegadensis]